ncbi:hypothetical protein QOZ80_4AG0306470 [Eleusine coracana subsp. coracana]|nr:hypothetical protein QOZ80_4AG0306470 [Eleusine coracana subsp. coracana]
MASGVARCRLAEERKAWRKSHPFVRSVMLHLLNDPVAWKPSITVQQILVSVQELLDSPNTTSPAQLIINRLFAKNTLEYKNRVGQQAKLYPLPA